MHKFWSSEKLLGLSAILISLATLFTVRYQTDLMRKQQYASVLPYLEIWPQRMSVDNWALILENNGLGPAFVKKVQIVKEDSVFEGDLIAYLQNHFTQYQERWDTTGSTLYANIVPGRLIPAGEKIEMFRSQDSKQNFDLLEEIIYGENVKLEIIYASVYDEYWVANDYAEAPVPCKNAKSCGTKSPSK